MKSRFRHKFTVFYKIFFGLTFLSLMCSLRQHSVSRGVLCDLLVGTNEEDGSNNEATWLCLRISSGKGGMELQLMATTCDSLFNIAWTTYQHKRGGACFWGLYFGDGVCVWVCFSRWIVGIIMKSRNSIYGVRTGSQVPFGHRVVHFWSGIWKFHQRNIKGTAIKSRPKTPWLWRRCECERYAIRFVVYNIVLCWQRRRHH